MSTKSIFVKTQRRPFSTSIQTQPPSCLLLTASATLRECWNEGQSGDLNSFDKCKVENVNEQMQSCRCKVTNAKQQMQSWKCKVTNAKLKM